VSLPEHFGLDGRKALVVGADSPAGRAVADAFAEANARVERIAVDLSDGKQVERSVSEAIARLGGLDIAACCPDLFMAEPLARTDDAGLARVMAVNFGSQFVAARACSEALAASDSGGRLILLTHVLGERGLPNTAAYSAAQSAVQGLMRALTQEFAPQRVTVNCIELGWMDWMQDRLDPDDEDAARAVRFTISKRAGQSSDIGPLAVWIAGSGGGYVSGQSFAVDGGLLQHL